MRLQGADINLTQLKHVWKGNWDVSTVYYLNEVVKFHGQSFVCITTDLSDERKYGLEYRPTVANEYWQPFSHGYLIKGGWNYKTEYYPGDIVKYNSDWYLCKTYTFGGHPIYENGGLTSKWVCICSSHRDNKSHNGIWLANYNPMGWTKNHHESQEQFWTSGILNGFGGINGDYCPWTVGRFAGFFHHGTGEDDIGSAVSPRTAGFDFWDYYDGYRTSITGGMPRCIQYVTNGYNGYYLFDNGEIYSTGTNVTYGSLGDGTVTNSYYPRRVGRIDNTRGSGLFRDVFFIKISSSGPGDNIWEAANNAVLALDSEGRVWGWGYDKYGNLGRGTANNTRNDTPELIPQEFFDNAKIVDVWSQGHGSYNTSFALDENGQLWAWGYAAYGILGSNEYFDNTATYMYNARPTRVALDWTKYGGIKKFIVSGGDAKKTAMVLTNDNQLWSWGYSSHAAGWGAPATETTIPGPMKLHKLIYEKAKSLGVYGTRDIGGTIDVAENIDDFWLDANATYETLYMKEKNTNLMFALGYGHNYNISATGRALTVNDSNVDTPIISNTDTSFPTLMTIGNADDIKTLHRHTSNTTSNRNYYALNSDGRLFSVGNSGAEKGIGLNFNADPHTKAIKLPWEFDLTAAAGGSTQIRTKEKFSMITGHHNGGFLGLTTNNRILFCGTAINTHPLGTYSAAKTDTTQTIHNPIRLSYFT